MGQVNATYSGDTNYGDSTGSTSFTVNPGPDFSMAANPNTITITRPGQSGSTMLTLTAMNGLTGTFNLVPQCAALPSESSCGVSPASVTFSSTVTTATVTLTVSTTAPSSVAPSRRVGPTSAGRQAAIALCMIALVFLVSLVRRRPRLDVAFSIIAVAALLTMAACGGGGGGGGPHDPGTPVGLDNNARVSFTLGTATHSIPISINVQ
jgi:hypothetical protein